MRYVYPWIPEGDPLELEGVLVSARADLVKGTLRIAVDVPLTPAAFELRGRLATIIENKFRVAVDVQVIRMQLERLADLRSAPPTPGHEHQPMFGDFVSELAERMQDELGPEVTVTAGNSLEPLPTLLEAQITEAAAIAKKYGTASASLLQRKMRIGYPRAAQLLEGLRNQGLLPAEAADSATEGDDDEQG